MITEVRDYTDQAFTRPVTGDEHVIQWHDEIPFLGGSAQIKLGVTYYCDNGVVVLRESRELLEVEITWEHIDTVVLGEPEIAAMQQWQLDQIADLIEDEAILEKL